jgi:outer membrane receptor protein involved in Fe transport
MQVALPPDPPAEVVVVTGRALPEARSDRIFLTNDIDRGRLERSPVRDLEQILRQVPGLQLFRRSDARSGHPTSQGVTLRGLGGNASSRALVILDGVPQSDPFGGWVNWPAYDPASIARIRVVHGGGSVINGPGALAGTIEMTSWLEQALNASVALGSRDSRDARIFAGGSIAGGKFALSAHGAEGEGFNPVTAQTRGPADRRAPYRQGSLRALWAAPLQGGVELQVAALAFTDRRERGLAFTDNRTDGADASLRIVSSGRWQWSALGYGQWRELKSSFASVSSGRSVASRASLQDSVPSHAVGGSFEVRPPAGDGSELRMGGDFRRSVGESRELYSYVNGDPTRRRVAGGQTLTAGLFAEATISSGPATLIGGARLDRWRISNGRLHEVVIASGTTLRDDRVGARSGWLPTGRIGGELRLGGGFNLRSAAYLGWRLPTLNELFRPFRVGPDATAANPLLQPERVRGVEVGGRYNARGLRLSATWFANRLRDPVGNVTLAQGPGQFPGVGFVAAGGDYRQRQNLYAIKVQGVEISAEYKRGEWRTHAGISSIDARVQARGAAYLLNGLRPAQTPAIGYTAGLEWESEQRMLSLVLRHVGAQFEDDLNRDKLPSVITLDALAAWPLTGRLQLLARAENLLDKTVAAGIAGDGSIERATPRTLWLELRFSSRRD